MGQFIWDKFQKKWFKAHNLVKIFKYRILYALFMDNGQNPILKSNKKNAAIGSSSSGKKKFFAVIIALVIVIAGLGIVLALHTTVKTGSSSQIISANSQVSVNQPYTLNLSTNGPFNDIVVYWGDSTSSVVSYNGSDQVSISHYYQTVGTYYIYYEIDFGSSTYNNANSLIEVSVSTLNVPAADSEGLLAFSSSLSSPPITNSTGLFTPGSHVSYYIGYSTVPSNTSYSVFYQKVNVIKNDTLVNTLKFIYNYNQSSKSYSLPLDKSLLNLNSLTTGIYALVLYTYTGVIMNGGGINGSIGINSTKYVLDIPVFNNAAVHEVSNIETLVNPICAIGGYRSLDPALAQDSGSEEIQMNTLQSLVIGNGSSTSQFNSLLASALPTVANGGINNNYANYSVTAPNGQKYNVEIKPYENYTFHIRSNAKWQNGSRVTAWDVEYSIARVLLYDDEPATTPGYLFAPYLLPGNYLTSNTFWNITQNVTVNNATNNITFHFQKSLTPIDVFEMLSGPGSYIVDPSWLVLHGDGLTWSPSGFQAYKATGIPANWNSYVTANTFSDGPYMISYQIESSEVVLVTNPYFVSPGPWYPAPSIGRVIVQYISEESTIYLALKSGTAQISNIPSNDWVQAESLNSSGTDSWVQFPTLLIYPAFMNGNVNTASLSKIVPSANMPANLFSSLYVRRAFAYAFNYSYFINDQLNNPQFKGVSFGAETAGILQQGLTVSETMSQLNQSTGGNVPYTSLTVADNYWKAFMNQQASLVGISETSSGPVYNGKPLVIPVFIQSTFTVGVSGVETWGSELSTFIPNIQLLPVSTPISQIIGNFIQRPNPMPIWIAGWSPENANAYGNIEPLAAPNNGSQILPADGFLPYEFSSSSSNPLKNSSEYYNLSQMNTIFENSVTSTNQTQINKDYTEMNNIYVNETFNVYLGQIYDQWVFSNNINVKQLVAYDENPVTNADNILYFNWVSYT
jgi:ABC-type transport system substrate-binding protein